MKDNLGTKRQCPKCDAKFYDFGATETITCPKCGKSWQVGAEKKTRKRAAKKETPVPLKKAVPKKESITLAGEDIPDVEDGDEIEELEPIEDEGVEVISLEEVEEHEEEKEADPDSDEAEDEMFVEMGGEKLVDDLEQYIETDEDEEDNEEE